MANTLTPAEVMSTITKNQLQGMIAIKNNQIEQLKKQFENTNYKTATNIQCEKTSRPLPYVWEDIYQEAAAIKHEIDVLLAEIEEAEQQL